MRWITREGGLAFRDAAFSRLEWPRLMSAPYRLPALSILVPVARHSSCGARIPARSDNLPIEYTYGCVHERIFTAKSAIASTRS